MKKTFCISAIVVAVAFASGANAENLLDVYGLAVQNDATLAAAQADWQAAQERVPQARSQLLPQLSVSGSAAYNHGKFNEDQPVPVGYNSTMTGYVYKKENIPYKQHYNTYGYTVSAKQPIFRYQSIVTYQEAKEEVRQAGVTLSDKKQDLMMRTAAAYFDILQAEVELELAQSQKQALSEQLEQAKARYHSGVAAITDVNESKAKFDKVRADEVTAKNKLETSLTALETIIGTRPNTLARLETSYLPVSPQPDKMDYWVKLAQTNNAKVRVALSNAKLAGLDIKKSEAGHLPTLDLTAQWQDQKATGQIDEPKDYGTRERYAQVGVQLNIPIFQGGYVTSTVREATAKLDSAERKLDAARRKATYDAETSFDDIDNAINSIQAYQQAVDSASVALKSVKMGQRGGIRTTLDVLNAQQNLYDNRKSLADSYFKYFNAYLKLKYSAGELSEADLATLNHALQ